MLSLLTNFHASLTLVYFSDISFDNICILDELQMYQVRSLTNYP